MGLLSYFLNGLYGLSETAYAKGMTTSDIGNLIDSLCDMANVVNAEPTEEKK